MLFFGADCNNSSCAADNISFSCFYDNCTTLTKNGSLVKVFKLSCVLGAEAELLQDLQSALKKVIHSDQGQFAVWINTIKSKSCSAIDKKPEKEYNKDALTDLFDKHQKHAEDAKKYKTEFYISVVSSSLLKKVGSFKDFFLLQTIKGSASYAKYLADSLDGVAGRILQSLYKYSAKMLSKEEKVDFFSLLFCAKKGDRVLSIFDLSNEITRDKKIFFGFNAFEIFIEGKKKFGAVLKIKDYSWAKNIGIVDTIINLDAEFIITEILSFANPCDVTSKFEDFFDFQQITESESFSADKRLQQIKESIDSQSYTDFCSRHLSITVFADSCDSLTEKIGALRRYIYQYGKTIVRYDLLLENAFWLNFPGNFEFFTSKEVVPFLDTCHFACTHTHFLGDYLGNYNAKFISSGGVLHFLNLRTQSKDNNILTLGGRCIADFALQNFLLLTELIKDNVNFMMIDSAQSSKNFMRALDGQYNSLSLDRDGNKLNILDLDDEKALSSLLKKMCSEEKSGKDAWIFAQKIAKMPAEDRSLDNVEKIFKDLFGSVDVVKSSFSHFFCQRQDKNIFLDKVAFDLQSINSEKIASLLAFYLLHKYTEFFAKKKKRFVLILQDASLFKNLFESELELDHLLSKICDSAGVLMLGLHDVNESYLKKFAISFKKFFATKTLIYKNSGDLSRYRCIFEDSDLSSLQKNNHSVQKCFLLNQNSKSIVLSADFLDFDANQLLCVAKNN